MEKIELPASVRMAAFTRYAWATLIYNVIVILWGVFLRASKSGDGCGRHWLTCQGEVIPSAPELKALIEYSHRITSFFSLVSVVVLVIWAFRRFGKGDRVRRSAVGALIFVVTEALVGAGLVLTGNTAETLTNARPFWMAGHLLNTFILLGFLTSTAWFAKNGRTVNLLRPGKYAAMLAAIALGITVIGMAGSLTALSEMLFPAESLLHGIDQDLSSASHILVRLRLLHPILSVVISVFVIFAAGWLARESGRDRSTVRWSNAITGLLIFQIFFGGATLLTLAPIVMQVGHLLIADLIWVSCVLLALSFYAAPATEAGGG